MATEKGVMERGPDGTFVEGKSGNKLGRPKGSRNKVTLMKLMAEQAVREGNADRMIEVCRGIIDDALAGDKDMRKLVWQAVMSKSGADDKTQASDKVEIHIGGLAPQPVKVTEINVIDNEDDSHEQEPG